MKQRKVKTSYHSLRVSKCRTFLSAAALPDPRACTTAQQCLYSKNSSLNAPDQGGPPTSPTQAEFLHLRFSQCILFMVLLLHFSGLTPATVPAPTHIDCELLTSEIGLYLIL